jgi:hypothetical protein
MYSTKQASSLRSKVRDLPSAIQDSFYDLDGADDEDLTSLAHMFNSSEKLKKEINPQKSTSSKARSGRTIPWATSPLPLQEEDSYTNLDFSGDEEYD